MTSELCKTKKTQVLENVKEYYGKVLQSSDDLKTQACVTPGRALNAYTADAISLVHEEVAARYYGCGLVIPAALHNTRILDLGSGSGRDCFALSKLVGESGQIIGIDMTAEQIEVARQYIQYHTNKFAYSQPNTSFIQGYIEDLTGAGLQPSYFDIIVSNCVVNLSPDKRAVLSAAYNVLKEGGELYFSDVYTDTHLKEDVKENKILWGECIAGALHWQDLHDMAAAVGFSKPYLVTTSPINIDRADFRQILGAAKFCSATYRLFKLVEGRKGYVNSRLIYKGELPGHQDTLIFDHTLTFKSGEPICVSGDRVTAIKSSRFAQEFEYDPQLKTSCCAAPRVAEDPFQVLRMKGERGENIEAACCGPAKKSCC